MALQQDCRASVYNDSNQRIGSVDDLMVGQDGKISEAVISVGGFLRIESKLVEVPYDHLRFEESAAAEVTTAPGEAFPVPATAPPPAATNTSTPLGAASPRATPAVIVKTTRIVLAGASKDSLSSMPSFSYNR